MDSKRKYYFFVFILLRCGLQSIAQTNPVYIQNFGQGNADPFTIGKRLPAGATDFTFSDSLCPPPGSYTIARRVPVASCFNGEWILLSRDDTRTMDYGMMMQINNITSQVNRLVYKDTVKTALCPSITYHYDVGIINLSSPSAPCPHGPDYPVFEYRIEDDAGVLIKKDTTRPGVHYAGPPPPYTYAFNHYGFDFFVPPGVNKLVVKLNLLHATYWCAEDFAIDDVAIYPVGPEVKIEFTDEPPPAFVKSVCFQQNANISMKGTIGSYYSNTKLQWQQSIGSGYSWTDIAGATDYSYSRIFSTPDTFLLRLSGGDASVIANPNCRVQSNVLRVEVDGPPTGYSITSNSPVCSGQDLIFNAEGAASYEWTGPNGFYDNVSYAHIYNSLLADSGMYYVNIKSHGGCTKKDSIYVVMIGTDVHAVQAGSDTGVCKGRSVKLGASGGVNYSWTPSAGLSDAAIQNPLANPDVTTVYTVKVTDSYGCSDTASVKVKILNPVAVKAGISATDYLCMPYDSISFTNTSTGKIKKWNWDFGNGQTAATSVVPEQYYSIAQNEDSYIVRLAVADSFGCADTAYHNLKVVDNCYIAVPKAFTPNSDGLNDYLYPLNAYKATDLLFRVFNRKGQLVFETRNWQDKWDGTINGNPQESGTYIWVLGYNDESGKQVFLKGTSVLIR